TIYPIGVATQNLAGIVHQNVWFTGDIDAGAPTFYMAKREDKGIVGGITPSVLVDDNQTLPFPNDWLGLIYPISQVFYKGTYNGRIEAEVDDSGANEQFFMELYIADSAGAVIDSGITSEPVGDLGVRPLLTLDSGIRNMSASQQYQIDMSGVLREEITIAANNRVRAHFLASKVGSDGPAKIFYLYCGNLYNTFMRVPPFRTLGSLVDVDISSPATGNLLRYNGGYWLNDFANADEVVYDNSVSLLTATDVQAAIDEVDGLVDGIIGDYVDLTSVQTVAGVKTWSDQGIFTLGLSLPTVGVTGGLYFGDGDTGFYENTDDNLYFSAGGAQMFLTSNQLTNSTSSRWSIRDRANTSTSAIFVPNASFNTTGLGSAAGDQLSLIADGIEGLRVDSVTASGFARTWLNPDGAVGVNTGLWFGNGNTGIYESSDDNLIISTGGSGRIYIYSNGNVAGGANTWALANAVPSSTTPNLIPHQSYFDTGIGWAGVDELSLIAGGVEGLRVDESSYPGTAGVWVSPNQTGDGAGVFLADGNMQLRPATSGALWIDVSGTAAFLIAASYVYVGSSTGGAYMKVSGPTVAAPAYSFRGDGDSGLYRIGADQVGIAVGGAEGLRVETTGTTLHNRTTLDELLFSAGITPATEPGGLVWWNDNEYTLNISTGLGPVLQTGQEIYLLIYNDSGFPITNFTVLRPK
ncbi:MAG: hypothetical protein KAJ19_21990, partial [Gammaproteobacteria bacterium]|nr:hypothetical protein [Gammaproteobacteria bacterium]